MNDVNHLFIGDCKIILPALKAQSVQTVVTSPPYFGLRDYGVEGQIGQEDSVEEYVKNLVAVFHEVKRVLKDDGTLWLNLGDSYAGSNKNRNAEGKSYAIKEGYKDSTHTGRRMGVIKQTPLSGWLKPKDLIGVPWRVAFALQEDGWYLRQDIIWHKPNAMPKAAARIFLEVTNIRKERLQDITEEDAKAEGAEFYSPLDLTQMPLSLITCLPNGSKVLKKTFRVGFYKAWQEINGKNRDAHWNSNPTVWVIEFRTKADYARK